MFLEDCRVICPPSIAGHNIMAVSAGRWLANATAAIGPVTMVQGMAELSVLGAGTTLRRHTGRTNSRIRLHLPLSLPGADVAEIVVGGERRQWVQGQVMIWLCQWLAVVRVGIILPSVRPCIFREWCPTINDA